MDMNVKVINVGLLRCRVCGWQSVCRWWYGVEATWSWGFVVIFRRFGL